MGKAGETEGTVFDRLGDRPPMAAQIDWTLIRLNRETETISLSFSSPDTFTNPTGSVHGGVVVAMLDECMGSAVVGLSDARYLAVTVSMSTDFIKPVPTGKVFGEGRVTSMNDKSAFLEARIMNTEDVTLARATGFYRIYPFQKMLNRNAGNS